MKWIMNNKITLIFSILIMITSTALIMNESGIKGKVLCFGDSITYGAFVRGYAWDDLLNKQSDSVFVVNAGRNGRKTSDKKELMPVLKENTDANYVLFFLGVNDLKNGNDSMVNSCVDNMRWMINRVKEKIPGAKIVLMAPTNIDLKEMSPINVKKKYNANTQKSLRELAKKYKVLAKQESVGFINLLNTVSPGNYVDGLHPDKKGQKQIAEKVWTELNKLYH